MQGASGLLRAKEAQVLAGLDYTVEKWPLAAMKPGDAVTIPNRRLVPRKWATVRTDTGDILGVVGDVYRVLQNEAAFAFLDALVDDGGAKYETAGVLNGGARVFISMEVPDSIHVEGDPSEYRLFLVVTNAHDGLAPVEAMVTIERCVCRNTVRIAHERALATWRVRHTSSLDGRMEEARKALGLSFAYAEAFSATAGDMVAKTLTDRQVDRILADLWPLPQPRGEATEVTPGVLAAATFTKVKALYHESDTVAPVRGTAYGVMNAVTEYLDHVATYSGRTGSSDEDVKATSLLYDGGAANAKKQQAWDLLVKVTK
jgi:phage/plasmid-like protein (TIGR03299 family)